MNADRRIVPPQHVASVLQEENISERTIKLKNSLNHSPHKIHKIANKWTTIDGINPLGRVMLKNVDQVPRKKHIPA